VGLTEIRYYRWSLALPLAVPMAAFVWGRVGFGGDVVVLFLVSSLLVGGIPYGLLVAGVLVWSRNRPAEALRRLSYLMPLFMAALSVALFVGIALVDSQRPSFGEDSINAVGAIGPYVAIILVLGYAYVIVVNSIASILRARGSFVKPLPN
jgi:hypothetical protein